MLPDCDSQNAYFSAGPSVQCMWSQHSLHHHLYSVHCDLQYPHILSGPCAPGECRHSTFYTRLAFSVTNDKYSKLHCCVQGLGFSCENRLCANVVAHYIYLSVWSGCVSLSPCLAGPTSLSFSQPRMHHTSGRLPDQHHGLWGVCPTHPSAPLLSPWVHLQLWNRCSEVLLYTYIRICTYIYSIIIHQHHLCAVCSHVHVWNTDTLDRVWVFDIFVFTSSITYNGSMESPVPLYPTDCPPPYEAVMGQRAASQVSMCVYVRICVCVMCDVPTAHADPCLFWLSRQQCMTPTATSCLEREELLLLSAEKVRNHHMLSQLHLYLLKAGVALWLT